MTLDPFSCSLVVAAIDSRISELNRLYRGVDGFRNFGGFVIDGVSIEISRLVELRIYFEGFTHV